MLAASVYKFFTFHKVVKAVSARAECANSNILPNVRLTSTTGSFLHVAAREECMVQVHNIGCLPDAIDHKCSTRRKKHGSEQAGPGDSLPGLQIGLATPSGTLLGVCPQTRR